ncbi:MAG TPA: hypothetical protein H9719_05535 [Candidatus Intestinimonas stercoravium]|nr:hypothetical protein [Candidatus Intestinimonas stercoravium]
MKKTALLCLLALLLGCGSGFVLGQQSGGGGASPPAGGAEMSISPLSPSVDQEAPAPEDNTALLEAGSTVLQALRDGDIQALSGLVHPERGVTFTPYSTVDPISDLTFLPDQLTEAAINRTQYVWGTSQGGGGPIELSLQGYLDRYVYNADYSSAPIIGVDSVISSGNSLENVAEAYPDARFLEYYFPSLDPSNNSFDWCALKTVFVWSAGKYQLVALIHSEWTI